MNGFVISGVIMFIICAVIIGAIIVDIIDGKRMKRKSIFHLVLKI